MPRLGRHGTIVDPVESVILANLHQNRVWLFLEEPHSSAAASIYASLMVTIIVASLVCSMLLSMEEFENNYAISITDLAMDISFLLEVIARYTFCPNHKLFWFDMFNLIDFCSVMPLLVTLIVNPSILVGSGEETLQFIRLILVIRPTLRLLKMARHFSGFRVLVRSLSRSSTAFPVVMFMLIVIVSLFASLLYFAEQDRQINTIPHAYWFALVTVSTVGYGDTLPETPIGQILTAFLIVCGVMYSAMPLAIIGANFTDMWKMRDVYMILEKSRSRFIGIGKDKRALKRIFAKLGAGAGDEKIDWVTFTQFLEGLQIKIREDRMLYAFLFFCRHPGSDGKTISLGPFAKLIFPTSEEFLEVGNESGVKAENVSASTSALGDDADANGKNYRQQNDEADAQNNKVDPRLTFRRVVGRASRLARRVAALGARSQSSVEDRRPSENPDRQMDWRKYRPSVEYGIEATLLCAEKSTFNKSHIQLVAEVDALATAMTKLSDQARCLNDNLDAAVRLLEGMTQETASSACFQDGEDKCCIHHETG